MCRVALVSLGHSRLDESDSEQWPESRVQGQKQHIGLSAWFLFVIRTTHWPLVFDTFLIRVGILLLADSFSSSLFASDRTSEINFVGCTWPMKFVFFCRWPFCCEQSTDIVNVLNAVAGCKQGPSFGHITLAVESELLLYEPARLAVGTLTSECGPTSSTVKSKSESHDCHPLIPLLIFF